MDSIAQCMVERASHEQERDETSSGIVSEEEIDKKELEAHYSFMKKIQEVLPAESKQHSEKNSAECADERAALANLIANLTLDTEETQNDF
ncbi:hypothetical protein Tco_0969178 [Tanacetum coccineum]